MPWRKKIQNFWLGPGPGVTEEVPSGGPKRLWFVIKTHYMELIGLNILFLVFCIPIITIPAAFSGMTNILMKWIRSDPVFFWQDFFAEFKAKFVKRLLTWLLLIISPISLSLYPVMLGYKNTGSYILLLTGAFSLIFQAYLFPIFVIVDIPVGTALKDAVFLTFVEWKCTIRILITTGILFTACLFFTLFTIPVIVICLVSLYQLTICLWVNEPINKRLILPQKGF